MAAGAAAVKKAVETTSRKASHTVKEAVRRADDPSFVAREICIGLGLGLIGGCVWKVWHLNYRRQVNEFYDALDKGDITVVLPS